MLFNVMSGGLSRTIGADFVSRAFEKRIPVAILFAKGYRHMSGVTSFSETCGKKETAEGETSVEKSLKSGDDTSDLGHNPGGHEKK